MVERRLRATSFVLGWRPLVADDDTGKPVGVCCLGCDCVVVVAAAVAAAVEPKLGVADILPLVGFGEIDGLTGDEADAARPPVELDKFGDADAAFRWYEWLADNVFACKWLGDTDAV